MGFHMVETLGNIMETRPYFKADRNGDPASSRGNTNHMAGKPIERIEEEEEDEERHGKEDANHSSIRGRVNPIVDVELNVVAEDC